MSRRPETTVDVLQHLPMTIHENNTLSGVYRKRRLWFGGVVMACAVSFSFQTASFLTAKELVLLCACFVTTLLYPVSVIKLYRNARFFLPVWVGLAYMIVFGLVYQALPRYDLFIETVLRIMGVLFYCSFCLTVFPKKEYQRFVENSILLSAVLVAILGVLQFANLLPLLPPMPGYDQRVYSVFGNQDLFGAYLALALPLVIIRGFKRIPSWPYLFCFGILLAGLALSQSRSAWAAAAVAGVFTVTVNRSSFKGKKRRVTGWTLCFLLAGGLTAPVWMDKILHTFSLTDVGWRVRLWIWHGTLGIIRDHGMLGVGPGQLPYWIPLNAGRVLSGQAGPNQYYNELDILHAHSDMLEIWAELGLVGLVLALWMVFRAWRYSGTNRGSVIALIVFSLVNTTVHSVPHLLAFFLLSACQWESSPPQTPGSGKPYWKWSAITGLCMLCMVFAHVFAVTAPQYLRVTAEQAMLQQQEALPHFKRMHRYPGIDVEGELSAGIYYYEQGRYETAYAHLLLASKGIDSGKVHLMLGVTALELGRTEIACRHLRDCLARWPFHDLGRQLTDMHCRCGPPSDGRELNQPNHTIQSDASAENH